MFVTDTITDSYHLGFCVDRGGGGHFMGRAGDFGGGNFGRGKMTSETVHPIRAQVVP